MKKFDNKNFAKRFLEEDEQPVTEEIIQENIENLEQSKVIGKEINFKKEKVETRSKQVHCFMKPSLYKKIKVISKQNGISCNEVINRILENTIE